MEHGASTFVLGWKEWLALPDLGLPAVKAKIDTGAKTSALHAFQIEPFGPIAAPRVRFGVHPVPRRPDVQIFCSAPVVGRREITSSNGEKELRYVIASRIAMGERIWPVEITLTNREAMAYRMLLGRQAIQDDMVVDPASAYRQPRLSYKRYRHVPKVDIVRRALRIALLTSRATAPSNRRIALAADARGHVLEALDPAGLTLSFAGAVPGIDAADGPIGHYDAVIARPRSGEVPHAASLVRQLELMGGVALNGGDAIERMLNPVAVAQVLARAGIACHSAEEGAARRMGRIRLLVAGGKVIAGLKRRRGAWCDAGRRTDGPDAGIAETAVGALQLGLASVDIAGPVDGREVVRVSASPVLQTFQQATGVLVAEAIIAALEARVRSWVARTSTER